MSYKIKKHYGAFAVVEGKCHFCNEVELIRFGEHYIFCPNCSVIYTTMVLQSTSCEHIKEYTPAVSNDSWFPKYREMRTYIKYKSYDDQKCSVCGAPCEADGW